MLKQEMNFLFLLQKMRRMMKETLLLFENKL